MSTKLTINSKQKLHNGVEMPVLGLGTYQADSTGSVENVIEHALKNARYIHLDTAEYYQNEREIGIGIKRSGVPRESIFITSKLWAMEGGREAAVKTFEKALESLQTSYLDQYLLHAPQGGRVLECYDALLEFEKQGKLRSVGVSNFGIHHLEALVEAGRPLPVVNQIELHPWCRNQDIIDWCRKHSVAIVAYCPLARTTYFKEPIIQELCKKHAKNEAQIFIRWSLQMGYICLPKSADLKRISENADVFDFELDADDMQKLDDISKLGKMNVDWDPTVWGFEQFGPKK